jgi:hypothetical protein
LFTWNKQLLCHEQLRATAHQLIEHCTQGMAARKSDGHGASASHPIKKLKTTCKQDLFEKTLLNGS